MIPVRKNKKAQAQRTVDIISSPLARDWHAENLTEKYWNTDIRNKKTVGVPVSAQKYTVPREQNDQSEHKCGDPGHVWLQRRLVWETFHSSVPVLTGTFKTYVLEKFPGL